ncbi:MAG: AbrB/MazE/SpoVT family DNA-binding domain-containing protein, partial [Bacillota bacterium]
MARLTTKGQITIPVELRRFLDLRAGDYIIFEKRDSRVEMKKMP